MLLFNFIDVDQQKYHFVIKQRQICITLMDI